MEALRCLHIFFFRHNLMVFDRLILVLLKQIVLEYRKRKNTFFSYPIGKMEQIHYNLRVDILFIDNLIGGGSTVIVDKNGEEVKPSLQPFIPLIPSEYWKSK